MNSCLIRQNRVAPEQTKRGTRVCAFFKPPSLRLLSARVTSSAGSEVGCLSANEGWESKGVTWVSGWSSPRHGGGALVISNSNSRFPFYIQALENNETKGTVGLCSGPTVKSSPNTALWSNTWLLSHSVNAAVNPQPQSQWIKFMALLLKSPNVLTQFLSW